MSPATRTWWAGAPGGTGACAETARARPFRRRSERSFFYPVTTTIATDLLTPLGAYLRLRERAGTRGSFLLESVERGRLGRYSFVGCGSRLVAFATAEASGEPVVGYLGYDVVATLEPTVPLPAAGPGLPESSFVVP